jgi:hypothetical protein
MKAEGRVRTTFAVHHSPFAYLLSLDRGIRVVLLKKRRDCMEVSSKAVSAHWASGPNLAADFSGGKG